jgi:hypothetical protein
MVTVAAPRIDERLRRFIAGTPATVTPAELTREVGELAWRLGVPRPSYEQVRRLVRGPVRPLLVLFVPTADERGQRGMGKAPSTLARLRRRIRAFLNAARNRLLRARPRRAAAPRDGWRGRR